VPVSIPRVGRQAELIRSTLGHHPKQVGSRPLAFRPKAAWSRHSLPTTLPLHPRRTRGVIMRTERSSFPSRLELPRSSASLSCALSNPLPPSCAQGAPKLLAVGNVARGGLSITRKFPRDVLLLLCLIDPVAPYPHVTYASKCTFTRHDGMHHARSHSWLCKRIAKRPPIGLYTHAEPMSSTCPLCKGILSFSTTPHKLTMCKAGGEVQTRLPTHGTRCKTWASHL
jgi:hypothetical protein